MANFFLFPDPHVHCSKSVVGAECDTKFFSKDARKKAEFTKCGGYRLNEEGLHFALSLSVAMAQEEPLAVPWH